MPTEIKLRAKYRTVGGSSYKSASSNGKMANARVHLSGRDLKDIQEASRKNERKRVLVIKANGKARMQDA